MVDQNRLVQLANAIMGNRPLYNQQQPMTPPMAQPGMQTNIAPTPGMLGTGMASNAANGMLMREYQMRQQEALANGTPFPATFEAWMATRR